MALERVLALTSSGANLKQLADADRVRAGGLGAQSATGPASVVLEVSSGATATLGASALDLSSGLNLSSAGGTAQLVNFDEWQNDASIIIDANSGTATTVTLENAGAGTFGLSVQGDTTVTGDLLVQGTTTSIGGSNTLFADDFVILNSEYVTDTAVDVGLLFNIDPATTSFGISSITSNVITVTSGNPSLALATADFILLTGQDAQPENNGVFEVLSVTTTTITIDTTPVETISQTSLTNNAVTEGTVVGLRVCVFQCSSTGTFQVADGTAAPLSFSDLAVGAGNSFQQAYNQGPAVQLADATGDMTIDTDDTGTRANFILRDEAGTANYLATNSGGTKLDLGSTGVTVESLGAMTASNGLTVSGASEVFSITASGTHTITGGSVDLDVALDSSSGITNSGGEHLFSGGNLQLNDSIVMTVGTGDDYSLSFDNVSGELRHVYATALTLIQHTLGSATTFRIEDSLTNGLFSIDPAGDARFFESGGSTGDRDFQVDGYAAFQSTVEFDGTPLFDAGATNTASEFLFSGGNLQLNDSIPLEIGTGADDSVIHNATDTIWTHATGDLIFDNTNVTGSTIMRLGTTTAATSFEVRDNSNNIHFSVDGAGGSMDVNVTSNLNGPVNLGDATADAVDVPGTLSVSGLLDIDTWTVESNGATETFAIAFATQTGVGIKGGNYSVQAGTGSGTEGAGGDISVLTGGGGITNGNAGDGTFDSGAPAGAGTGGTLFVGGTNAEALELGRLNKITRVKGDFVIEGDFNFTGDTTIDGTNAAKFTINEDSTTASTDGGCITILDTDLTTAFGLDFFFDAVGDKTVLSQRATSVAQGVSDRSHCFQIVADAVDNIANDVDGCIMLGAHVATNAVGDIDFKTDTMDAGTATFTELIPADWGWTITTGINWLLQHGDGDDIFNVTTGDISFGSVANGETYTFLSTDLMSLAGGITVTGVATFNGNTVIGSDAADTVAINADIASDLIPDGNQTRTFGDVSNGWVTGFFEIADGATTVALNQKTTPGGAAAIGTFNNYGVILGDDLAANLSSIDTLLQGQSLGPWDTTTNVVHLDTSTDNVTVGSATNLGKLAVDGDTDEIQFVIQGHSTQTNPLQTWETSVGADVATMSNGGALSIAGAFDTDDTTASTTPATGSGVFDGGVGIAGDVFIGGAFDTADTTTSTSTTTGSGVFDGGVGIAENINIGGTGNIAGNFDATGGLDVDADGVSLTVGAGNDWDTSSDGLNATTTVANGDYIIDVAGPTSSMIINTGTDTNLTDWQIRNNSLTPIIEVFGDSTINFGINATDTMAFVIDDNTNNIIEIDTTNDETTFYTTGATGTIISNAGFDPGATNTHNQGTLTTRWMDIGSENINGIPHTITDASGAYASVLAGLLTADADLDYWGPRGNGASPTFTFFSGTNPVSTPILFSAVVTTEGALSAIITFDLAQAAALGDVAAAAAADFGNILTWTEVTPALFAAGDDTATMTISGGKTVIGSATFVDIEFASGITPASPGSFGSESKPWTTIVADKHLVTFTSSAAITAGAPVFLNGSGQATMADASAESTAGVIGICTDGAAGSSETVTVGMGGKVTINGTLTAGDEAFLSETTGTVTATPPSTTSSVVKPVGYMISATVMAINIQLGIVNA